MYPRHITKCKTKSALVLQSRPVQTFFSPCVACEQNTIIVLMSVWIVDLSYGKVSYTTPSCYSELVKPKWCSKFHKDFTRIVMGLPQEWGCMASRDIFCVCCL